MWLVHLPVIVILASVLIVGPPSLAHAINPFKRSGFELSESDIAMLKAAAKKLYLVDTAEVGAVEAWNNAETGNSGTVTLILRHSYKDLPCRRLQHDIRVVKVADPFRFIVDRCKIADGSWKLL